MNILIIDELLSKIEKKLTQQERYEYGTRIYSSYSIFDSANILWRKIILEAPKVLKHILTDYVMEVSPYEFVNAYMYKYYPNESIIKSVFSRKHLNRDDEITFFEMNVGKSRLDLARINGHSSAYEIKTEFDTLNKLEKQVNDYYKVFEFVYIIIHKKHTNKAMNIVPNECGIIEYKTENGQIIFNYKRKAEKNSKIDSLFQLEVLTKSELIYLAKKNNFSINMSSKSELISVLNKELNDVKINKYFKEILKNKYQNKWKNIKKYSFEINDIDTQLFFKNELEPNIFYNL